MLAFMSRLRFRRHAAATHDYAAATLSFAIFTFRRIRHYAMLPDAFSERLLFDAARLPCC